MARKAGKKIRKTSGNTPRRKEKKVNYEIVCLVIIATSILMGLSFFTNAIDPLGSYIKSFFMGLFGAPAYLFSFVLLGAGIHFFVKRKTQ